VVAISACNSGASSSTGKPYTGVLRTDDGTIYVHLEQPSALGGQCAGWNTVSMRSTANPQAAPIDNLLCWRRDGDEVIVRDAQGRNENRAPRALLTD